jgi:RNA polymerase sigma-70 factor (ECF subfamily)
MPPPPDVEALLAHAGWIRSLARSLVADASRADDLVQRTFVAALEHPPGPSTPLRRWLGAVARNFARQDRRADARRAARELSSARPEAVASAHESVEAIAIQRELFEAVLALDEPYRTTIVQRFYEGLPPREIARRANVPVKTVKTRLARALEKLRVSLDGRHGGTRGAWLSALLPLAIPPALPASTLWTVLVDTKIKIAVAVLALAGAAAVAWNLRPSSELQPVAARMSASPGEPLDPVDRKPSLAVAPATVVRENAAEDPSAQPAPAPSPPNVEPVARGRVLDVDGRGVAGVPLVLVSRTSGTPLDAIRRAEDSRGEPNATSRADGSFELKSPAGGGTVLARSADLTTVFGADLTWSRETTQENLIVVVAPRIAIGGVVVSEDGVAIEHAVVEVRVVAQLLGGLAGIADQSFDLPWRAQTDERGRFEIADAPAMKGARIAAELAGYARVSQPAPTTPSLDLRIVLRHVEEPYPHGEVVDSQGKPVAGALVACNSSSTKSDDHGRFAIDFERMHFDTSAPLDGDEVVAIKEGFLPARLQVPREEWREPITLRLGSEALEICGRVVDERGNGIQGAELWPVNEHPFGVVLEDIGGTGRFRSMEEVLRGGEEGTKTGENGTFVLRGLLAADYRITCLDHGTMRSAEIAAIPAGTKDARFVLDGADRCVHVAGRVVSRSGKPVEGVLVFPGKRIARWPFVPGNRPFPTFGESATTDAEGRFAFERLLPDGLTFQLGSPKLLMLSWDPPAGAKLDDLEITVALRCHLQIDLGDRLDLGDSFIVLRADGEKVETIEYRGPTAIGHPSVRISHGRSPVVAVTDDATTLVLSKGNQEVARLPLTLSPGELTVVRP